MINKYKQNKQYELENYKENVIDNESKTNKENTLERVESCNREKHLEKNIKEVMIVQILILYRL